MSQGWYYARDGRQAGPYSAGQLQQLARTGQLQPSDLVWQQGMPGWAQARSIPNLFPQPQGLPREVPAAPNPGVTATDLEGQIRGMLQPGEAVQACVKGLTRFGALIEYLPFVCNLADFCRRRYVLVLTDRRLLCIRVSRIFQRVKACTAYPLAALAGVDLQFRLLTAVLSIHFRDGTLHRLQKVNKQAGQAFSDRFHALVGRPGGIGAGVRDAVAEGVARARFRR
jgi:hypothetical protein